MVYTLAFLRLFGSFLNAFFKQYGWVKNLAKQSKKIGTLKDFEPPGGRGLEPEKTYNVSTHANSSWVGEVGWVPVGGGEEGGKLGNIWIRPQGYPKSYVFPNMPFTFFMDLTSPGLSPGDGVGTRLWRGGKLGHYYGVKKWGVVVDPKIRDVADIFQSEITTGNNYLKLRNDFGFNRVPSPVFRR